MVAYSIILYQVNIEFQSLLHIALYCCGIIESDVFVLPGSVEERGLRAWACEIALDTQFADEDATTNGETEQETFVYNTFDFPVGMSFVRRYVQKLIHFVTASGFVLRFSFNTWC